IAANYCVLASSTLLWLDILLTLGLEVQRMWQRRFTGATVVFLLTRYSAALARAFFVSEVLSWTVSNATCHRITRGDDVLLVTNYFAFAAFTILRGYGVTCLDWRPLLVIAPLSLVKPILTIYESTRYTAVQGGLPYGMNVGEFAMTTDALYSAVIVASETTTIAADLIVIALTWRKTFNVHRDMARLGIRTTVSSLFLVDGKLMPFVSILTLIQVATMISNIVDSVRHHELSFLLVWAYFGDVLVVIFHSRFMLDLRGLYYQDSDPADPTTTIQETTVSAIVGNMGAT
ncbi:uncharacterized protein BXZ73DRAFT_36510, partial [Epithele typhae]|uniref:uncharacterized protein n=1 Tax=Epithele typhae TaxID=378194 RepID=UPI002007C3FD